VGVPPNTLRRSVEWRLLYNIMENRTVQHVTIRVHMYDEVERIWKGTVVENLFVGTEENNASLNPSGSSECTEFSNIRGSQLQRHPVIGCYVMKVLTASRFQYTATRHSEHPLPHPPGVGSMCHLGSR
jgi:hypothetical protein